MARCSAPALEPCREAGNDTLGWWQDALNLHLLFLLLQVEIPLYLSEPTYDEEAEEVRLLFAEPIEAWPGPMASQMSHIRRPL